MYSAVTTVSLRRMKPFQKLNLFIELVLLSSPHESAGLQPPFNGSEKGIFIISDEYQQKEM